MQGLNPSLVEVPNCQVPLIVDLDGTLIVTDTLWECIVTYLKDNPLRIFQILIWLIGGKAKFKSRLAEAVDLDVSLLPYRSSFVDWLKIQKAEGRTILLATAADQKLAYQVADCLDLFDGVIASDGGRNASGAVKTELIGAILHGKPYEYAGNSLADMPVWKSAAGCVVVAPGPGVMRAIRRANLPVTAEFNARPAGVGGWLRAIRLHQWAKNILIFTPLLTSHRITDAFLAGKAMLGFLAFSAVASAIYLINDLTDLPADRAHNSKKDRPLASGMISIPAALAAAGLLLVSAAGISLYLPPDSRLFLLGYLAATLAYSSYVKKLLLADVVALGLFYTARVLYGGLVTEVTLSIYTVAFSVFMFFTLAATKRINDLATTKLTSTGLLMRRAYRPMDREPLVAQASSAANLAILILILYLNSAQVSLLYHHPAFLWGVCPPLYYWFNRTITLANRGSLCDDPILFFVKDKASYAVAIVIAAVVALAL